MREVFEMVIQVVLALAVVGFVGYPLVKGVAGGGGDAVEELPEELEELLRRKESTYAALKELEFDHKMGKLSDEDFGQLEARYREDALEILAAIEEVESGVPISSSRKRRAKAESREAFAAEAPDAPESAPKAGRKQAPQPPEEVGGVVECAECGRRNQPGARFCASCGTDLAEAAAAAESETAEGSVCSECGHEVAADHRFCAGCGAEFGD